MTSLGWITLSSSQIIKSSPGTENLVEESRRYARSVLSYTRKAHYLPTSILNSEVLGMEDFYSLASLMLECILSCV